MPQSRGTGLPRNQKRRDEEILRTEQAIYETTDAHTKTNCNIETAFRWSVENYSELNPVLIARNLTLNSDAANL